MGGSSATGTTAGGGGTDVVDGSAAGGAGGSAGDDGGIPDAAGGGPGDGGPVGAPLLGILDQFTAPDVPVRGPNESAPIPPSWTAPANPPTHPGNGIAEHPMLYAGESYNTIFLVNKGKVIWTYSTGSGGEIDDVWMLTNGHVLYARMSYLEEITPKKEVVWHYDPPAGTESHSVQPIGLDKVLFVQNGTPAKIIVMNKTTKMVEVEHDLTDAGATVHPQFRRIRMTAQGTYLAPYLEQRKVVEYDKNFQVVWTYSLPNMGTPWAAIRLHNGNTLIQDEHNKAAHEVNPQGQVVWEFKATDLPAGIMQRSPQTSDRLENGNTVIFSPGKDVGTIQAIEVTPAKQAVWILQDWKNLGPCTTAQLLDQPGIPERPGDLQH
jgi:hypothetical protein